jgi:hypothetical protein
MRIGDIERVGKREIPMPRFTPPPVEPTPSPLTPAPTREREPREPERSWRRPERLGELAIARETVGDWTQGE